jgi:DUF1016 N-terminal domain
LTVRAVSAFAASINFLRSPNKVVGAGGLESCFANLLVSGLFLIIFRPQSYGNGFSVPNLSRMVRFAEVLLDPEFVVALSQQLSWSHFVELIPLEDSLKRDFYAEMCRVERWSVRTLRQKIGHLGHRCSSRRRPNDSRPGSAAFAHTS